MGLYAAFGLEKPAVLNGPQFLTADVLQQPLAIHHGEIECGAQRSRVGDRGQRRQSNGAGVQKMKRLLLSVVVILNAAMCLAGVLLLVGRQAGLTGSHAGAGNRLAVQL